MIGYMEALLPRDDVPAEVKAASTRMIEVLKAAMPTDEFLGKLEELKKMFDQGLKDLSPDLIPQGWATIERPNI